MERAAAIGIDLLTEEQYRALQQLGEFDTKTSSWIATPAGAVNAGRLTSRARTRRGRRRPA